MKKNQLSSDFELEWPEKGDNLFITGEDWPNNACLNFSFDNWELYIQGYKTAAENLVINIESSYSEQDILIYPIVFLYRHYLELRLKNIIKEGRILFDEDNSFPMHHKLDSL